MDLKGKTAVVTGAGRGIGRSIALTFAKAGADLAICSRTVEELTSVREEAEALGVKCFTGVVDLSDAGSTEAFCRDVLAEFGSIHVLVNNAGAQLEPRKVVDSDPDKWWATIEVNLKGPYLMVRHLLEGLSEGSKIINLSSGVGITAGAQNSSYCAAKAGLHLFTEALANELGPNGIEVNNLIPGPVATSNFNRDTPDNRQTPEEILENFKDGLPANFPSWERLKHPDEVADMALYMASMPTGGPTGQTFSLARRPL